MRWTKRLRPVIVYVLAAVLLWTGTMPGGQAQAADSGIAITVQEALSRNNDGSIAKVKGYVIGQVPSGGAFSAYTLDPARFQQDTNVIIADNIDETNTDNMLIVQISAGFRAEFGPNTNRSLYHTQLIIGGTLTAYFGKKGLKDPTSFEKVQSSTQAAAVTASPASGAVPAGTWVTLSAPTVSASVYLPTVSAAVYYSLSSSVDKSSFVPYTGPIPIAGETTISAYAAQDGLQDSEMITFHYTLLDTVSLSDIAAARIQPANTPVRIHGIVTYREESGGFANLYVQDLTGGIVVRGSGVTADVGDEIEAYGPITLYNGLVQIEKDKAGFSGGKIDVVRSSAALPAPLELTSNDFAPAAGGGKGEGGRYEGMLVSVRDATVTRGGGTTWYATDAQGKELTIYAKNVPSSFSLGTTYEQLTGVLTYHSSYGLELLPRSASDVVRELLSVQASVPPGGIIRGGSVGLSTPQAGAAIHYTTDGTAPTEASAVYSAPIVINANTTIKAIAALDAKVSPVYTFTYTPVDQLDGLHIHDIQGVGHSSPYNGLPVSGVAGIVTAVVNTNSFYMQELPGQEDESSATSEAIRVYRTSSGVNVGDSVTVAGTVNEYASDASQLTTTEISASAVTVVSSGNPLPAPVKLGKGGRIIPSIIDSDGLTAFNPETDAIDFDESLEWMRVQLDNATITGPYASDTGVSVIVDNDPANPLRTPAGGVILKQDGPVFESALNPQRMFVSTNPSQPVKTGDSFSGSIEGVMTYTGGNYKIVPSGAVPAIVDGGHRPAAATLPQDEDQLTIATFNVENFAASSPVRAGQIAAIVTDKLHSPDIVALMEIQDNNGATNDGTVDASASFQAIINAIANNGGPAYSYTDIAPVNNMDGGEGGGNIRVGFLFQEARVTLKGGKPKGDAGTPVAVQQDGSLTLNPGRIDPGHYAFTASRKPLAAEFEFKGERVVVIANHFNSKGGDQKPFGAVQPAVRSTETQRAKQAEVVNSFVKQLQGRDPSVNVVVLGDLNDFQFSRTLDIVTGGGKQLTNLVDKLPENKRYSYIYEGNSQTLDHILVNPALADYAQLEIVHVNADFEEADGRVSDHDPLLAQLDVKGRSANRFDLRVLHTNDTHAHLESVARRVTAIKQLRTSNSLLLDAGDVFSGTLYFNKYDGLADLWFMNQVGYDAMTFGNHEFDKGSETLKPFVQGATFPFVSANIDYGTEPNLSPLFQSAVGEPGAGGRIYPSVIRIVDGEPIGIFGLTTPDTAALSSPGEQIKFKDIKASAEAAVKALEAKGVNKIIALSHIGFNVDEQLAQQVKGIDIIVGGHSHTPLFEPKVYNADQAPTVVVQTGEYGANVGQLDASFNAAGVLTSWNGKLVAVEGKDNAGQFVFAPDAEAAAKLAEYAVPLEDLKKTVIGRTLTVLDGERGNVRKKETNLGDLMADGMLAKVKSLVPQAADVQGYVTIQNGGGIRASIDAGDITLGELLTVMPFGNNLTALKMTGAEIVAALENGVSGVQTGEGRFPQVAGMRFYYDSTKKGEIVDSVAKQITQAGERIMKVQIKNADGSYSDIKPNAYYIVATNSFMADGGDFYASMKQAKTAGRLYELNLVDYEVFREYLNTIGEVNRSTEGRITDLLGGTLPDQGGFNLRVLHTNDTHAHLDNIARRVTAIKQARTANSLLLDAGDVFSGTLYFNKYDGLADLWFMNKVGYDAMTFGNHEFDKGPATLKTFVQGAQFPIVSANIDYGTDPNLSPLFSGTVGAPGSNGHIYPSIIKVVNGEKIGIFGLTTPDTAALSSPGEKISFKYNKASAEAAVAALKAKGVNKIIALSHIGFSEDEKLADEVEGIDIIVGGHSHTKLTAPVVHHADKEPTIIVQTGEYAANLGQLDATFDASGVLTSWNGKLIEIDSKDTAGQYVIAPDAEAAAKLAEYTTPLEELKKTVIGRTTTVLDGERGNVRKKETNLGDLMADGMLAKVKSLVPQAADVQGYVTIQNGGGIRASIDAGDITLGELLTVMPFGNNLTALKMTGTEITAALENGVSGVQTGEGRFPQVAGMRFYYDSTKQGEVVDSVTGQTVKTGQRIVKVQIKNADGTYSDIIPSAYYIVATNSFMADGGDFYRSMKQAKMAGRLYELNLVDYEVFREYLDRIGTVNRSTEGRITDLLGGSLPGQGGSTNPSSGGNSGTGNPTTPVPNKPETDKPEPGEGPAAEASFSDVPADHWASAAISRAINRGIVTGYPDDTFRPEGTTTRAEFAAMLSRALGLPAAAGEPDLADWSRIPAWARPFIAQAVEAGIVNGYADGTFRPSAAITRTEMAVMLVRALALKVGGGKARDLPFEDASAIPAWAAPYIAAAYDAGLVQGSGGQFRPNAEATRAEVVTMILAVIDYMGK